MRDLIRNYKLTLKDPENADAGPESQPLLSSHSSNSDSFGATRSSCFFNGSDTTEFDYDRSGRFRKSIERCSKNYMRRPFCFPSEYDTPALDVFTCQECIYDNVPNFATIGGICRLDKPCSLGKSRSSHSSLVTIFAIWNTIMGSSLLAMSWGLQKSGLFPGIILNIVVAGLCLYTCFVVLKVNQDYGLGGDHTEVSDLCRILLGTWAEATAKLFSLIVLIGANIVYWVLMSNFLYNFVHFLYGVVFSLEDEPKNNDSVICPSQIYNVSVSTVKSSIETDFDRIWDLYSTVPIFLSFLMFPLMNFKSPTFFTKFNSLGTLSVMYLLVFVGYKSYSWGINMTDWSTEWEIKPTFVALSGMLSLSYFIHNIIISIMRHNEYPEHNARDLGVAFGLVTFTYTFIGVAFYISFPLAKTCIEDNILNNFEKYDGLTIAARVLLLFQLFTVFPLMSYMLRIDVLNILGMISSSCAPTNFSYIRVGIVNLLLVIVCILFACFLPRIGTLIRYTGALSGMVYIFLLPSLLKIATLRKENRLTPLKLLLNVLVIILGVINLFSQFLIKDQ